MLLAIAFPLLFSVFIPATPFETVLAELQESHIKVQETPPYEVSCSCVAYAVSQGANIPLVDAKHITPTTTTPYIGATAVFYYPNSGLHHVAIVTFIGDTYLIVDESNFSKCKIKKRIVFKNDKRLLGYL